MLRQFALPAMLWLAIATLAYSSGTDAGGPRVAGGSPPSAGPAAERSEGTGSSREQISPPTGAQAQSNAGRAMERALRVMTFNIRYANPGDGPNAWRFRRDWVAEIVRTNDVDILGCQEVLKVQQDDLLERLPGYASFGPGRDDGKDAGEAVPIFYRRERFKVLKEEAFWLSETPDVPGSKGWGATLPRVTTYLRLKDWRSGATLSVVNTHLDHMSEEARRESARLINRYVADLPSGDVVILTGDFNCLPSSAPYRLLTEAAGEAERERVRLYDSFDVASQGHEGPESTWNGFKEIVPQRRIDFVFVRRPEIVRRHRILDDRRDGRFPSDHLPVVVDLVLPK